MSRSLSRLVPLVLVAIAAGLLSLVVFIVGRDPIIDRVSPPVASIGAQITVEGRHFRDQPGSLLIGSRRLPSAAIVAWSNDQITFVVPRDTDSGLVRVVTERGRSRGALLQLSESLPRVQGTTIVPSIAGLSTSDVVVGRLVEINGSDFGRTRRSSEVRFTMSGDCRCVDIAYAHWSDDRIVVRVPNDVTDGELVVSTPWGTSNAVPYRVARPAGGPVRGASIEVAIQYGVRVSDVVHVRNQAGLTSPGHGDHDVLVPVPRPVTSFAQDSVRFIASESQHHLFERVAESFDQAVVDRVVLRRHAVRFDVDPGAVPATYEAQTGFFDYYTRALPGLSIDSAEVRAAAAEVRRGRTNPYRIAEAAYALVLQRLTPALGIADRSAAAALSTGYGDSLAYAQAFVGVLRAAVVPARVVGGLVVTRDQRAYPHFWAEFFVPDVGWVPADPSLGDGAFPARFPVPDNPAAYYFGGLDAYRVAFAYGYDSFDPPQFGGARAIPDDPFTVRTTYLAAGSGVESVRIDWPVPRVLALFE
ncbi:MAG: hypothetical protein EA382_16475 [Spirochaetaceae bacterium]|nr:MAG: hypothetical protein EA382_16475 [Spirochaetaceae bacterium]